MHENALNQSAESCIFNAHFKHTRAPKGRVFAAGSHLHAKSHVFGLRLMDIHPFTFSYFFKARPKTQSFVRVLSYRVFL